MQHSLRLVPCSTRIYVEHSFISNTDREPLKKKSRWGSHSQIDCNHLYMYFVNEESVADSNYVEIKYLVPHNLFSYDRISGLLVSVLTSCVVVRGFEPRSGQTKDYNIDMCCFSVKHGALRRKSKDWLARNQDNVSEWSDMSIRGLAFQWVC